MRLATTALLLAASSLTACSGTTTGTGTLPGASKSGFDNPPADSATDCTGSVPCNTATASGMDAGKKATPSVPSEYDPLFDTPASATVTGNALGGVWAGYMELTSDDVRLVITPSAITIAVRCNSGSGGPLATIGLTVSAVTTSTSIRTLESKSVVGTANCKIFVHPQTLGRCSTGSAGTTCFDLIDTSLDFGPNYLFTEGPDEAYDGPAHTFSKMRDGT